MLFEGKNSAVMKKGLPYFVFSVVLFLLLLAIFVQAITLSIILPPGQVNSTAPYSFTLKISIDSEKIPIEYLQVSLTGQENYSCQFLYNGSNTCANFSISIISDTTSWESSYSDDSGSGYTSGVILYNVTVGPLPAGNYTVDFTVTTNTSNYTSPSETVEVISVASDTYDVPVITLLGSNPDSLEVGSVYVDAGATASDVTDGDLTANMTISQNVNSSVLGNYTYNYSVVDSDGNSSSASRIVTVVDTTAPVIVLNGSVLLNITLGSNFTETGYSASDNYDGNLTSEVVVNNTVNSSALGSYTVSYYVEDSSGNSDEEYRIVTVISSGSGSEGSSGGASGGNSPGNDWLFQWNLEDYRDLNLGDLANTSTSDDQQNIVVRGSNPGIGSNSTGAPGLGGLITGNLPTLGALVAVFLIGGVLFFVFKKK